ncbi:MAG: secondary thiamine-phosphate synthase enzyme YjbQ [Burkholderiales bacterium]
MTYQTTFDVRTGGRGMIDITSQVASAVDASNTGCGIAHVFVRHTSCSVLITENADASVRRDLELLARRWAPDGDPAYRHATEGDDDMAAHARSLLAGVSVSIPLAEGKLLLGTWQGVYLWEHRTHPHTRTVCVTVVG